VSGALRLLGRPRAIADHIRERVRTEQGLTCSVGVAATKFMAKLASDRAKPDGVLVVPAGRTLEFLHPLPVEVLWGVGERTCEVLRRLGLRTVGDVAEAPVRLLRQALGEAAATHLHELAHGRDPRRVSPERVEKSSGAETTFDVDVADPDVIRRTLLELSNGVARRLRRSRQAGRTVAIKVRLADFRTLSRSRTLATGTDVAHEIFSTAWQLFQALDPGDRIRLIGVRVEGLAPVDTLPSQPTLGSREHGWRDAERAADAAADRFGGVVGPASLLRPGRMPDRRTEDNPGSAAPPSGTSGKSAAAGRSNRDTGVDDAERAFDPLSDPLRPS
jgi:DNA polymerase-4